MKKNIVLVLFGLIVIFMLLVLSGCTVQKSDNQNYKIVTSFYPIYIMTLNITDGAQNVELINMTDQNTGCIHDYVLSTNDMKKIEKADLFIENGLGLENFTEKIKEIYSDINILNSSENVSNIINDEDETNPHIWTSIENYISQIEYISKALIHNNPQNAKIYEENTKEYILKLNELNEEYKKELKILSGKKALCLNEAIEYIAKDLNMEVISIHTDHDESTISAESLKSIISKMKNENIKIILIGKDDNKKNAELIANETDSVIYDINTSLNGENDKDSYINDLKENIDILKTIK